MRVQWGAEWEKYNIAFILTASNGTYSFYWIFKKIQSCKYSNKSLYTSNPIKDKYPCLNSASSKACVLVRAQVYVRACSSTCAPAHARSMLTLQQPVSWVNTKRWPMRLVDVRVNKRVANWPMVSADRFAIRVDRTFARWRYAIDDAQRRPSL